MAINAGPKTSVSGLTYCLDIGSVYSYSGSGLTWDDRLKKTTSRATILDNGPAYSRSSGGIIGFDGTNDMVKVPNLFPFSKDGSVGLSYVTFEMWYRGKGDTTGGYLISKPWNGQGEYNYRMSDTGYFVGGGSPFVETGLYYTSVENGSWRHLVWWISPTQMGYYFDGGAISASTNQSVWTGTLPPNGNSNYQTVLMSLFPYGAGWGGISSFSTYGDLAMFKIYDKVLTANEVKTNYESTRGRFGL